MKGILLAVVTLGLFTALSAHSQSPATSGGMVLKQRTSVRAEGMGGAQTAMPAGEAGAVGWNPASLQSGGFPELSAVFYRGLADDAYGSLNYDMAVNREITCGGSLLFYDAGAFDLTTDSGETSSVSAQRDFLGCLTGAYRFGFLGSGLAVGASVKFLQSTLLGNYSAFAAALDAGALVQLGGELKNFRIGAAVKNLGTRLKYIEDADSLPAYGLAGLACDVYRDKTFSAVFALDAQSDFENSWQGNAGAEISIADVIALRGGYKIASAIESFTLGIGFTFENFRLDYAFGPVQDLNSTHLASLTYVFGTVAGPKISRDAASESGEAAVVIPDNVEGKPDRPTEKIRAELVEVRKVGGRAAAIVMNAGAEQQIKAGYEGTLVDASGHPVAAFVIRQVDPKLSLADVIGLSREIDGTNVIAIIEKPIAK